MHTFITGGVSVMCNAHFAEAPDHEKYQITVNYGEEEIAYSGEGLVTSIDIDVVILIFNVDDCLAALPKFVEDIPKLINLDNQKYNLGGVSVFLNQRRHYVVYIYYKESDSSFFMMVCTLKNLADENQKKVDSNGELSLIVYFKESILGKSNLNSCILIFCCTQ